MPPLTGVLADATQNLQFAMLLPTLCYAAIAGYGVYARRPTLQ